MGLVVITLGVVLLWVSWDGVFPGDNPEIDCGGEKMGPGDVCQEVGSDYSFTYESKLASTLEVTTVDWGLFIVSIILVIGGILLGLRNLMKRS